MENHLIIGLGGTGGRVLSAFRKIVHEKLHGNMNPNWLMVDYVYVDSSERDLKMEDPELWTVMGQSISLDESCLVRIPASNLAQFIENRSRYAYLAPWIGDEDKWRNIIRDPKIEEGAAGQKRRLGRLLFANGSTKFNETVGTKVTRLKTNPQGQRVNFHVVAGLAGGTGSGSIVDAVAQIRKEYPDTTNYKIFLYLLLPESGKTSWATTPNYMPNGYAALQELNAMEMGKFKPWNVGEREYEVKRLEQKLPFYSAYLVTDENTQNVSFNVGKTVPSSIAEFIFQKTIGLAINEEQAAAGNGQTQDVAEFFDRAERGENPKYSEYDQPLSHNFMTYGIKRFAIPEVEIKEYFGYSFASQALNQMLYNNITKESGYVFDPKTITEDDYSLVIDSKNRNKWLVSKQYLCLSLPVLPEHKKEGWQPINEEFRTRIAKIRSDVMADQSIKHNDKMMAIHNLAKKFYDKDFRPLREEGQNGVVNFYNDKLKYGKQAIAEHIVTNIENEFFSSWTNGIYSLQQLSAMAARLIESLAEERNSLKSGIGAANDNVQKATLLIKGIAQEWSGLNAFQKLRIGNTANKYEEDFTKAVTDKFTFMAWSVAYEFAMQLIDSIVSQLLIMKENIDRVNAEFKTAAEHFEGNVNSRCNDESEEEQSRQGMIIKYYDTTKVQRICKGSIQLEDSNKERIASIRVALAERLSKDKQNFKEAADKLKFGDIKLQMETVVMNQVKSFFENENVTRNIPQFEQLIGVNIVEKLYDEFNGNDEGLKTKLKRLVDHAAVMAKPNDAEIHDGPQIRKSMFVIVPKYDKNPDFLEKLKNILVNLSPATECKVSEGGSSNEIIVMNLEANVTPRYLIQVKKLREKYDDLINSANGDIAKFETRLEDYDKPLPELFKMTDSEKRELQQQEAGEALPYMLLAKAMGLLVPMEDSITGLPKLTYIPEDEDGLPDTANAVVLGKNIEKSLEKLDSRIIRILTDAVNTKLTNEYRHIAKQETLRNAILEEVKAVSVANGPLAQLSMKFTEAFKSVKAIFEKMNDM